MTEDADEGLRFFFNGSISVISLCVELWLLRADFVGVVDLLVGFDDELSFLVGVRCNREEVVLGHRSGVVGLVTVVAVETEDGVKLVTLVGTDAADGTRRADTARAVVGTVLFSTKLTGAAVLEKSGTHSRDDGATRFLVPF